MALSLLLFAAHAADAEAPQSDAAAQIEQLTERIKQHDTEIAGFETRIKNCQTLGYDRQLAYWEARRRMQMERRETDELRKLTLEAQLAGEKLPGDAAARLQELERREEARRSNTPEGQAAIRTWSQVNENLNAVSIDYGWHLAKVNLLRDLVHRARRVGFYLQEAVRPEENGMGTGPLPEDEQRRRLAAALVKSSPDAFKLAPIPGGETHYRETHPYIQELNFLAQQTRAFVEDHYGECYFGRLEQMEFAQFDKAETLLQHSEQMIRELEKLEARREALAEKVLAFLQHFDRDGKFADLGIPHRREDLKIDSDGRPNDMIFVTATVGSPGVDADPFCFDACDFQFYAHGPVAEGVIEYPKAWMNDLDLMLSHGYHIKRPITVLTHRHTPMQHPTFLEEHKDDPDIFLVNNKGEYSDNFNIWHPAVREMIVTNLKAYARFHKDMPNFLMYDKLTWEPMFTAHANPGGWRGNAFQAGYNLRAVEAFRAYLKDKFGDIAALNEAWRADYASFDAIQPPGLVTCPRLWCHLSVP